MRFISIFQMLKGEKIMSAQIILHTIFMARQLLRDAKERVAEGDVAFEEHELKCLAQMLRELPHIAFDLGVKSGLKPKTK